jgi:hypothetical protein
MTIKRGMMAQNRSIFVGWQRVIAILALAGLFYGLLEPAYCQDSASQAFGEQQPWADGTVLLLQQTNPEAGTVTPSTGVHYFGLNAEVTLTAVPKTGYYFVYWIGDVIDPTANSTIVYLDAPKIIIAVFERSEYEFPKEENLTNTLGGYGGLRAGGGDYARQGGGGDVKYKYEWPQPPPTEELPDEFPIPQYEESEDFPVPLPEPATVLLLGLGSLFFIVGRTKK